MKAQQRRTRAVTQLEPMPVRGDGPIMGIPAQPDLSPEES